MTGNSSGSTLIHPLIIRHMCHNVPPTAINTSVEFILKESIEFMTTYPHQWGMQSTLKQQNTHTLKNKSSNYALNVLKTCILEY